MIIRVRVVLRRTSAQVVETSVKVTPNSPSQDYSHPDDHSLRTYDMSPGFKHLQFLLKLMISPQSEILEKHRKFLKVHLSPQFFY